MELALLLLGLAVFLVTPAGQITGGAILLLIVLIVNIINFFKPKKEKTEIKKKTNEKIKINWEELEEKNIQRVKEKNKTVNTLTDEEIKEIENITEEKGKIDKKDVEEVTEQFCKHAIYKNFCIELKEYILKGKIERKIIDDEEGNESFFDINIFFDNRCDDVARIKRFLTQKGILKSIEEIKRHEKYIFYTTENLHIILEKIYIENKKAEKIKIFLEENNISFRELYYSKLNKKIYF